MNAELLWCRLGYAVSTSIVSCWFVREYSRYSWFAYKALHPDTDGILPVLCMFLHSYSYCLCAIPVLGGIIGIIATIKRKEFLHCLTVSLMGFLSYAMVLFALVAWVAQSVPRMNLTGVHW